MKIAILPLIAAVMLDGTAFAQTTDALSGRLVDELMPEPITRGWSRGITVEDGEKDTSPPSVDLYVNFEFDSDVLDTDASIVLDSLGRALNDPRLAEYHFLIAGHTDAKGTDDYNSQLSKRRADAVLTYLVRNHRIDRARLQVEGYGEARLLDPARPEDGINRRVQVVNLLTASPR